MPPSSLRLAAKSPMRNANSSGSSGRDWKSLFKKTIFLVLAISLAIHVLFLLAFGSVAIFKGSVPKLPFVSQEIAAEAVADTPPPPMEEVTPEEPTVTEDPFATEAPPEPAGEESAAALDMLTVVGGANWAPAIPKNTPVSETGVIGGTGKGSGTGRGTGKGMGGPVSGKQLFGVSIQARKLGVIADISGSMQPNIPKVMTEIFKNFPDADVVFVNGCGMMDWEKALREFEEEKAAAEKTAKDQKERYTGPKSMPRPQVVKFTSAEASDSPPIRGTRSYGGFRKDYPDWYEKLSERSNTWFVTSFANSYATALAFDHLARRKVEAIYWFADFADPIEGKAAEEAAQTVQENKIEVLIHSTRGIGKAGDWSKKVSAKIISSRP
ncbi:MAG: hypothetical protein EBT50_08170 [Verrucomicrobia bacterium]|nr:hypothetical protein [Verrucomicrobiota bacterium]